MSKVLEDHLQRSRSDVVFKNLVSFLENLNQAEDKAQRLFHLWNSDLEVLVTIGLKNFNAFKVLPKLIGDSNLELEAVQAFYEMGAGNVSLVENHFIQFRLEVNLLIGRELLVLHGLLYQ